jgi:hypothetical protein
MSNAIVAGVNDLVTTHPHLIREWSPNNDVMPNEVTYGMRRVVEWICFEHSHTWEAPIKKRSGGAGCPFCLGKKVLQGFNDLAYVNSSLAKEWSDKNEFVPSSVTANSGKRVWWVCPKDGRHVWKAEIKHRNNGSGCPACAGKLVIPGVNDLASLRPELVSQWSRKNKLSPTQVSLASAKVIIWICENKHEWETTVSSRTLRGYGCYKCRISATEIILNDVLKSLFSAVEMFCKIPVPYRNRKSADVDFYLCVESVPYIIEYDGSYWHKDQHRIEIDTAKTIACLESGYSVIRIRESTYNITLPRLEINHARYHEIHICMPPNPREREMRTELESVGISIKDFIEGL